jgi:23S rRNA pseudouridine2605 synthase
MSKTPPKKRPRPQGRKVQASRKAQTPRKTEASRKGQASRRAEPPRKDQAPREGEPQRKDQAPRRAEPERKGQASRRAEPERKGQASREGEPQRKAPSPRKGPTTRKPRPTHKVQAARDPEPSAKPGGPERIAKAMARAGLCSRREADRWIADGRVSVNGQTLKTPAVTVTASDRILVDGKLLPAKEPVQLWRYYKPKGLVTTNNDPQGRPTVFANLPPELPRVVSVGRLDFNSEGLLLLTNDGALARHMELPATGWLRRYRVRAHGRITQKDLDALQNGIEVEGVRYGPIEASVDSTQGANMWITVSLREGKNREVRRVLASLGVEVNRLIRTSYGPFQLLELKPGGVESVKRRVLADQLGPRLATDLGVNDPVEAERAERKARGNRRAGPDDKAS